MKRYIAKHLIGMQKKKYVSCTIHIKQKVYFIYSHMLVYKYTQLKFSFPNFMIKRNFVKNKHAFLDNIVELILKVLNKVHNNKYTESTIYYTQ